MTTGSSSQDEFTLVVTERDTCARDVVTLTLQREDGGELESWSPGAHVDLVLAQGFERQYSLCGDPKRPDRWRVAVLREPDGRGGSAYVHDKLEIGDSVTVRGPRNHFRFEQASMYLFVAGGIGITPILPMIARAEHAGADWRLWYGGRSDDSMAFRDELAWYGDRVNFWPQDKKGLLPLDEILGSVGDATLVYCCGPESLLLAVEERSAGWPDEVLRVERFSPKNLGNSARYNTFRVRCRQSGITVEVPPDRSILEVLEDAGLPVDSSCREGTCGTCESDVLAGRVDHRDSVLTSQEQAEGDRMMICVSRSVEDELVLDV